MSYDARIFKFNSNYQMDNIIYFFERTFTPSDYSDIESDFFTLDYTTNHGLSFAPLCFGIYSVDNGNTWNDIDFVSSDNNYYGMTMSFNTEIEIQFKIKKSYGNPPNTRVRIYGFSPDNNYIGTPPQEIPKFFINTNNTYDTLLFFGSKELSDDISTEQLVFTHNLGYYPRVLLWTAEKYNNRFLYIKRCNHGTNSSTPEYISLDYPVITTNALYYRYYTYTDTPVPFAEPSVKKIYYRIYGGELG